MKTMQRIHALEYPDCTNNTSDYTYMAGQLQDYGCR